MFAALFSGLALHSSHAGVALLTRPQASFPMPEPWRWGAWHTHCIVPCFSGISRTPEKSGEEVFIIKWQVWQGKRFVSCLKTTLHALWLLRWKCTTQILHNTMGCQRLGKRQRTTKDKHNLHIMWLCVYVCVYDIRE